MSAPLRVAVVGVGNFGTLHAETLSRMAGAHLTALVDADLARAGALAARLNVPSVFATVEELIASAEADAVIVATRTDSHLALAGELVSANYPVLVEKPLADSSEAIREFQLRFDSHPSVVMVDHLCLFHSTVRPLMERLRETGFRSLHFVRHRPDHVGRRFPEDHPIQAIMVHDLYVAAQLMGGEEPISFSAMESRNAEGRADMSWAALRWADGRTATFHCHTMLPEASPADGWDSLEVFGDGLHSHLVTNPAPWTWTDSRVTWPQNLEVREDAGMLVSLLNHFLAASRGEPIPSGCRVEDALQVQRWIEQLLEVAKKS